MDKKVEKVDEDRRIIDNDKIEREKIKSDLESERLKEERLKEFNLNQERIKTYNKEILRHNKNSKEERYICSLCELEADLSLDDEEQYNVNKSHFELKSHMDKFNEKIKIKSIEDKFVDIIFDFKKLKNNHIYSDLHIKEIIKEKIKENQKDNKKYKCTILKIRKYIDTTTYNKSPLQTIKITSYDIIKDINNLEYFEGLNLNKELNEDRLLFKYENEITKEENDIENSENYKKIIKYLKKNNMKDKSIKENYRIIIENLKIMKKKIIIKKIKIHQRK